jgi:hypothetical protein
VAKRNLFFEESLRKDRETKLGKSYLKLDKAAIISTDSWPDTFVLQILTSSKKHE